MDGRDGDGNGRRNGDGDGGCNGDGDRRRDGEATATKYMDGTMATATLMDCATATRWQQKARW